MPVLYRRELEKLDVPVQIRLIMHYLALGYYPVYALPPPGTILDLREDTAVSVFERPIVDWRPLTKEALPRYSLLLKTCLSLLGKLLPDLKSVEVTDEKGSARTLTDIELAQRISGVLAVAQPLPYLPPSPSPEARPSMAVSVEEVFASSVDADPGSDARIDDVPYWLN